MKEDKERILIYLLQLIDRDDMDYAKKTVKAFPVSTSTVYNYVAKMIKNGDLARDPKRKTGLLLPSRHHTFSYCTDKPLSEDRVFLSSIKPLISALPKNVYEIWNYCFTEMMNNAIEHSSAKKITCEVEINRLETKIAIVDDGIGIFKNIRDYLLATTGEDVPEEECPGYLFAGRFTTAKERHSGEGVFFTSHLLDQLIIVSSGIVFSRNDFTDVQRVFTIKKMRGTAVYMALSNTSAKTAEEVFSRFSDADNGFNKTEIPMAHLFPNGYPVSRSEARRLFGMIQKFQDVTLDFANVENVGQAFVHEFFLILSPQNPNVTITLQNVSDKVAAMISRVKNTL